MRKILSAIMAAAALAAVGCEAAGVENASYFLRATGTVTADGSPAIEITSEWVRGAAASVAAPMAHASENEYVAMLALDDGLVLRQAHVAEAVVLPDGIPQYPGAFPKAVAQADVEQVEAPDGSPALRITIRTLGICSPYANCHGNILRPGPLPPGDELEVLIGLDLVPGA